MSQGFRLRYDQLRENDPTEPDDRLGPGTAELYPSPGLTRNVCLVWPDGRRFFLNYAYLVAAEFEPNTEKNLIRLSFSSHTVTLQGYGLDNLFMALLDHLPRLINAVDERYVLEEDKHTIVTEIRVENRDAS